MTGICLLLSWGKNLQHKKYTLSHWYSSDIRITLCCIINTHLNHWRSMSSCTQGMWSHHCNDCILSSSRNIVNMSKDWPNNTQLHITGITYYCTHNNKEQDSHSHCMLSHSKKTYCCKKRNCLGWFMNIHRSLVVYIGNICCRLCQGKIQHGIECRKTQSYSKYNLKVQINKSDICYQHQDNTHPDIVNIGCCWDNVSSQECYQNRSNICGQYYQGSNCPDRQGKLRKSCIIDSRGCLLHIWDKFHLLSPGNTCQGMLYMWMNRCMCNNH